MSHLTKQIKTIVHADYDNKQYTRRLLFTKLSELEQDMLLDAAMNDYAKNPIDLRYELLVESPNFQRVVELVHSIAKQPSDKNELLKTLGEQLYQSALLAIEESTNKELAEQKKELEQTITHEQQRASDINRFCKDL